MHQGPPRFRKPATIQGIVSCSSFSQFDLNELIRRNFVIFFERKNGRDVIRLILQHEPVYVMRMPLKSVGVIEMGHLAYRIGCYFRSLPRRHIYPLLGSTLALATPASLLIARSLVGQAFPPLSQVFDDLLQRYPGREYFAASMALFAVTGFFLGRKIDRLRALSITDPLTGLFNRRHLTERLAEEMSRQARYGTPFSLLALDLDQLKAINDGLGHKAGNRALIAVAESISEIIRGSDVAARIGGDEFAVILAQTAATEAVALARRIATTLGNRCGPWRKSLSLSIGVTAVDGATQGGSEDVLLAADAALYQAKMAGGGLATFAPSGSPDGPRLITLFSPHAFIGRA